MPKIVSIFGSYSGYNKGDLAILIAILKTLLTRTEGLRIFIPSKRPDVLKSALPEFTGHEIVIYKSLTPYWGLQTLRSIRSSDVLVFGGGGLFFDKNWFNPFFNHVVNLFLLTLVNNYLFKKPVYIFSVGASHMQSRIMLFMTSYILKSASRVTVRDRLTAELFAKHYKGEIEIYNDPAFMLEDKLKTTPHVDQFIPRLSEGNKLLFVLDEAFLSKAKKQALTGELTRIINELQAHYQVVLTYNTSDCKIVNQLADRCKKHGLLIFHPNQINPEEFIYFFRLFNVVICSPMHAAIFSYLAGVRMITIEHDHKIKALNKIIGNQNRAAMQNLNEITRLIDCEQKVAWGEKERIRENALNNIISLKEFIYAH